MAQVKVDIGDYVFDASAQTITFVGVTIDDIEQIAPIIDLTANEDIYNPLKTGRGGTLAANVLTLEFDTNTVDYADTDKLKICFNQPGSIQSYGGELALGNLPGQNTVQIGSRNPNVGLEIEEVGDIGEFYELPYDTGTVIFVAGLVVTGTTSAATAKISTVNGDATSGTLILRNVEGDFVDGETITDTGTGSALVDSVTGQTKLRGAQTPTSGTQFELICESTNDTAAGTGAQLVLVEFMEEATGLYTTEVLATNGHTPVLFVSVDAIIFRSAVAILHGSNSNPVVGSNNVGPIIIRDSVSKDIQGAILTEDQSGNEERGLNNSLSSLYRVPAGRVAVSSFILVNSPKGEDALFWFAVRPPGSTAWLQLSQATVYQGTLQIDFSQFPLGLAAGTEVKYLTQSTNEGTLANAIFIVIERDV